MKGLWRVSAAGALAIGTIVPGASLPAQRSLEPVLAEFRSGDADRAVAALAGWPDSDVEQFAPLPTKEASTDPWRLAALALLHTEVGIQRRTLGRIVSGRQRLQSNESIHLQEREIHFRRATLLTDALLPVARSDAELARFLRDWHVLVSPPPGLSTQAPGFLAPIRFPDDATSWLLAGSLQEWTVMSWLSQPGFAYFQGAAGPRALRSLIDGKWPDTLMRNASGDLVDRAQVQLVEHTFRRALRLNPQLVEARLRLGRVLWLADRREEAAAEFRQITKEVSGGDLRFAGYLAALWQGQLSEGEGSLAVAALHYEQALAIHPGARSATIALSALRAGTGAVESARRAASALLLDGNALPADDPLTLYPLAQTWRHDTVRASMRTQVRQ